MHPVKCKTHAQKEKYCIIHVNEVPRILEFKEAESRMVAAGVQGTGDLESGSCLASPEH
jgi:hypothetical protein